MDILILLVVTIFLIKRLKDTLGTRTNLEKKRDFFSNETGQDNVIILPKRLEEKDVVLNAADVNLKVKEDIIKEKLESFCAEEFLEQASTAYEALIRAYCEKNIKMLEKFCSPKVYQAFLEGIQKLNDQQLTQHLDDDFDVLDLAVEKTEVVEKEGEEYAHVTVYFKSKQIITLHDENDVIVTNPAKTKTLHKDVWTFAKRISDPASDWILIKTKTLNT